MATQEPEVSTLRVATTRSEVPRRMRPSWVRLVVAFTTGAFVGLSVGRGDNPETAVTAAVVTSFGLLVLWYPLNAPALGISRRRLARLLHRDGLDGRSFPVRSTASFDSFPPTETTLIASYTHPWRDFQVMTLEDDALVIRQGRHSNQSGGARLSYRSIDAAMPGTVTFGDLTERAIILTGKTAGASFALGVVPVLPTHPILAPVARDQYVAILDEIKSAVEGYHGEPTDHHLPGSETDAPRHG